MNNTRRAINLACLGLSCIPIYAMNFRLTEVLQKANLISAGSGVFTSFLYQIALLGILYLIGVRNAFKCDTADTQLRSKSPLPSFRKGGFYVGRRLVPPFLKGGRGDFAASLISTILNATWYNPKNITLFIILFFAFIYRLLLVPAQPLLSSDMYRYIWDGGVQAHGFNPYQYPPGDDALRGLRDDAIYPNMNRHASPTIYPAGAQMLFYTLNRLQIQSISTFKGAVVLFDMGSILLLTVILTSLGLARERVLIYAWNPLVIYELAGSGHLEGFMLFFVLLSLFLLVKGRFPASISSLALAASMKLYPAILLPAILRGKKYRGCLLFSMIFLLIYLPYLGVGKKVVGFLPEYFGNPNESFNLGLKAYLLKLFPHADPLVFTGIFAAFLLSVAGMIWIKQKDTNSTLRFSYHLASLQVVLSASSLHPWYVIWIIPFLCLFPSPAWLYFSLAVCLSYLAYEAPGQILPEWVKHIEYIPFFALLAAEFFVLQKSDGNLFPWKPKRKKQVPVSQGFD